MNLAAPPSDVLLSTAAAESGLHTACDLGASFPGSSSRDECSTVDGEQRGLAGNECVFEALACRSSGGPTTGDRNPPAPTQCSRDVAEFSNLALSADQRIAVADCGKLQAPVAACQRHTRNGESTREAAGLSDLQRVADSAAL